MAVVIIYIMLNSDCWENEECGGVKTAYSRGVGT